MLYDCVGSVYMNNCNYKYKYSCAILIVENSGLSYVNTTTLAIYIII